MHYDASTARFRFDMRVRRALIDTPRVGHRRERGYQRLYEREEENERRETPVLRMRHRLDERECGLLLTITHAPYPPLGGGSISWE